MNSLSILSNDLTHKVLHDINALGFKYCSFGFRKGTQGQIISLFSHAEWEKIYQNHCLYHVDPLFKTAHTIHNQPIPWNAVPIYQKKARGVMTLREEIVCVNHGMTFSFLKKDIFGIVAIGDAMNEMIFLEKYNSSFERIKELSLLLHEDLVKRM